MNFINRYYLIATLLSVSVLLETLCYTYVQLAGNTFYYSSSVVYGLAGLSVCILPLLGTRASVKQSSIGKFLPYAFLSFIIGLFIFYIAQLAPIFKKYAINERWADMVPIIQLACHRLLTGKTIYAPATEINRSIVPYLPGMWLPFLPSEVFGYDARWTTVFTFFLALLVAAIPVLKRRASLSLLPALITCVALFLMANYLLRVDQDFWTLSEEGLVAGLYVLLGCALLGNNYWLKGLAITGCVLSRYSLLMWIPVYFGYVFFARPGADFWKLILAFGASMLLLFILPFFIHDPGYFLRIPFTYEHPETFWARNRIDDKMYHTVGWYKFFTIGQVKSMFTLEVMTSFLAPLIFLIGAWYIKKRTQLNSGYIEYSSLKLCLLFFYGFMQCPYIYLLAVPTAFSYAVMFKFLADEPALQTTGTP